MTQWSTLKELFWVSFVASLLQSAQHLCAWIWRDLPWNWSHMANAALFDHLPAWFLFSSSEALSRKGSGTPCLFSSFSPCILSEYKFWLLACNWLSFGTNYCKQYKSCTEVKLVLCTLSTGSMSPVSCTMEVQECITAWWTLTDRHEIVPYQEFNSGHPGENWNACFSRKVTFLPKKKNNFLWKFQMLLLFCKLEGNWTEHVQSELHHSSLILIAGI